MWKLCKAAWKFFSELMYWIPGNGNKIRILEDRIIGHPPLKEIRVRRNISLD